MLEELIQGLSDPVILFGHFTYLLLIVSMLMRRMVALRVLVVASARLNTATESDSQLRRTLEAALNRNLAGKLVRSNDNGQEPQPA